MRTGPARPTIIAIPGGHRTENRLIARWLKETGPNPPRPAWTRISAPTGLTVVEQARRERVRMEAAEMFSAGESGPVVAVRSRVSRQSGWRWQKSFEAGGVEALRSRGPHGKCRLSEQQIATLLAALEEGPAMHGWTQDQRWTLARICRLTLELFKVGYTPKGMSLLLKRSGWSVQVPALRAAERNEEAVERWRDEQWPIIKGQRGTWAPTSASRTRPDLV